MLANIYAAARAAQMKMSWVKASHPNQTVGCHSPAFSTLLTLVFNPGRKLLHKVMSKFWWVSVLK